VFCAAQLHPPRPPYEFRAWRGERRFSEEALRGHVRPSLLSRHGILRGCEGDRLGLGLGKSAAEIATFYRDDGRRIFPPLPRRRLTRWWKLWCALHGPKLNHEELERALRQRFEDHLLGESTCRLVIPAFMMPKTEIAVFKTDHHEDFRNDHKTPMWKVARATSAAPTYLKGLKHEESGRIFIDGGVWANNPATVALVDALTVYDITPDQVQVLSIGTGNAPFSRSKDTEMICSSLKRLRRMALPDRRTPTYPWQEYRGPGQHRRGKPDAARFRLSGI
jgi:hypothetical protein